MRWNGILAGSALAAVLWLAGCGMVDNYAAKQISARAPEFIGPADSYQTDVHGASRTKIDYLHLVGVNVRLQPNMVLETLELTLHGVHFNLKPTFQLTGIDSAAFAGRINEETVNNLVRQATAKNNHINNIVVKLEQGRVAVSAVYTLAGIDMPFSTTGHLAALDGVHINYVPETIKAVGINLPAGINEMLVARINPLVDLSTMRFTPSITSIEIVPGAITFAGTANVPENVSGVK